MPRRLADGAASRTAGAGSGEAFHEAKRLLSVFSARKFTRKRMNGRKAVEYTQYLTISALTVDRGSGACSALSRGRCGIYERRPLACRTVPFHYSRAEASAERDLDAFVGTPGYCCDITARAPIVLEAGRIVDSRSRRGRSAALARAEHDRPWQQAILRQLKSRSGKYPLPTLREIEAGAAFGATTTSMRVAWQIGAEAGIISAKACRSFIAAQADVIDRELAAARGARGASATLSAMRAEYLQLLNA